MEVVFGLCWISAETRSGLRFPAELFRLEFCGLPPLLEGEIVIFPLEAGAAPSSMERSCPESATLIVLVAAGVVVVVLALVTLLAANVETPLREGGRRIPRAGAVTLPEFATFVLDELETLVLELAVLLVAELGEDGGSPNDGGGEELVVAPAPAKVPVVLPFPPEPE